MPIAHGKAATAQVCVVRSQRTDPTLGAAGNQAAQNGFNPGFYNGLRHAHGAKPRMGRKSLVGSQVVTPMVGKKHHQTEKVG